jgi:hypothetical protein
MLQSSQTLAGDHDYLTDDTPSSDDSITIFIDSWWLHLLPESSPSNTKLYEQLGA